MNTGAVMSVVTRAICQPRFLFYCLLAFLALTLPSLTIAQGWVWTTEIVDKSGRSMSLAADPEGNLHMSYGSADEGLKYGFRPVGAKSQWFTMALGGGVNYSNL